MSTFIPSPDPHKLSLLRRTARMIALVVIGVALAALVGWIANGTTAIIVFSGLVCWGSVYLQRSETQAQR